MASEKKMRKLSKRLHGPRCTGYFMKSTSKFHHGGFYNPSCHQTFNKVEIQKMIDLNQG